MRFIRPASAALATAVLAASAYTAPASAQIAGVGTSLTSTKVLTASLGDGQLLDLLLLGDDARSTIDPAVAAPEAFSRLTALKASTSIVPNSPINITQGVFEAKSSGPSETPIPGSSIVPSTLALNLAPVISGSISPGMLTATLKDGVAASSLNAELADINAVGGLISLDSLKSTMGATSAGAASDSLRGASIKNLKVLDLGALLQGLGLPLGDLTPAQLVALVDGLAATAGLPLPSGTETLKAALANVNAAIDDLQATVATTPSQTSEITSAIDSTTSSLLGTVGLAAPVDASQAVEVVVAVVNDLIDELQALIGELLAKGLAALDNLSLLSLEGVEVGVSTKATESVNTSTADVTGKIGKVMVGKVALPGVDLLATAANINANVEAINNQIGDVLSLVHPDLGDLVKVSVLDKATSVTSSDGYTRSRAGVTAASATITPPANLAALVKTITDQVGVAETLTASSVPVPVLSTVMKDLGLALKAATSVLTSPSKLQVASVLSSSDFARAGGVSAPVSTPTLPRTGGSDLVLLGGLAGVLALAIRRLVRTPSVQMARIDEQ
jgi:hypothetical protein